MDSLFFPAVAGRAFARQGRKAPTRVGAQTRDAKARSGWGKGAIGMDMEDPCLLTQRPLRSERGDWLFGMGYWFVGVGRYLIFYGWFSRRRNDD